MARGQTLVTDDNILFYPDRRYSSDRLCGGNWVRKGYWKNLESQRKKYEREE
jgi:hypothetical protein